MASRNRGKPKPKLGDLSRTHPTEEEAQELFQAISSDGNPIAVAILAAVYLELELEKVLRPRFARNDDDTWKELLADNGPLSSFYAKIITGFAFRAYDERFKANLHIIRAIRNVFAHSKRIIRFDNELICQELKKVEEIPGHRRLIRAIKKGQVAPAVAYVALCFAMSTDLIKKRIAAMKYKGRRRQEQAIRLAQKSPIARALLGNLGSPKSRQGWTSLASLGHRTGDPTTPTPSGLLGLYGLAPPTKPDNQGK